MSPLDTDISGCDDPLHCPRKNKHKRAICHLDSMKRNIGILFLDMEKGSLLKLVVYERTNSSQSMGNGDTLSLTEKIKFFPIIYLNALAFPGTHLSD